MTRFASLTFILKIATLILSQSETVEPKYFERTHDLAPGVRRKPGRSEHGQGWGKVGDAAGREGELGRSN